MKLKKYFPLCYIKKEVLLLYKYGTLYLYNIRTKEILKYRKVIFSKKECFLARIDILYRFFRVGARLGTYIGDNKALIVIGTKIYEVNTQTLEITLGFTNHVSRPLNFGVVKGVKGFDDGVYWGDYMGNSEKCKISIYRRIGVDQWEAVYTFAQGEVNHIHNIVPDRYNDCVWIFTGDFDNGAAIWKTVDNFKTIVPILRGNQLYRGCVVFPTNNGLLFATDSPFIDNFIMRLRPVEFIGNFQGEIVTYLNINNKKWLLEKLFPIDGSCIYGMRLDEDKYVFQTTVEPDGRQNQNKWIFWTGRRRGLGIKDDYVKLYMGNIESGFDIVYKSLKDKYPYIIFQFGTFQFPESGLLAEERITEGESLLLPFFSVATSNHDLELQILEF